MGSDHSQGKMEADGLPSAGVSFYPASPEQLQTYHDEREALTRFKATLSPLVRTENSHEKLFVAAFDGTGNDKVNDPAHATNVARISDQLELLRDNGNEQIYVEYLPGPGTQPNPIESKLDSALGFTSPEKVEQMYRLGVDKANEWLHADPEVQVRALSSGFSRGGSQAAAFTNVLHERGIPDLDSRVIGPNGEITYTHHIVKPGQIRQAVAPVRPRRHRLPDGAGPPPAAFRGIGYPDHRAGRASRDVPFRSHHCTGPL